MKTLRILALALLVLCFALLFAACGGKAEVSNEVSNEATKGAFKLDVTTNIPDAATVQGSGYFDYNDTISASVNVKEGYAFLGWYFNETDLLSSQTTYNAKMWNQDVVLKAIIIKCPEGVSIGGANDPSSTYTLNVSTVNEECGLVSLNDGENKTEYTATFKLGQSFKILAYSKTIKRFLGWYGTSGELITTNASLSLTMPGFNYDLIAVWEGEKIPNVNDFTYIINENQGCSITGYKGSDTSLVLPSSIKGTVITSIGDGAFENCSKLTSVTIGNSVTSIGDGAFSGCSGLTSITIPNSVTSIGSVAFSDCSGLISITIPDSVTSIGGWVFSGCLGLTSLTVADENPYYHSAGNCIIHTATKELIAGCKNSIIPTDGSVSSIVPGSFGDCSNLTSIDIPNGVKSIDPAAFRDCSSLTSIVIPKSVTYIGFDAFVGCVDLTSITFTGTKAQWNAIEKETGWNSYTGMYTIHCTDGDIAK